MTQLLEDLRAVRELIGVPERWTRGAFARAKDGDEVEPDDNEATCFCLLGAFCVVTVTDKRYLAGIQSLGIKDAAEFNDNVTHPEVLALLDKAIAAEERRAAL